MSVSDVPTAKLLQRALLWAGIEDYCPLWQAVWEVKPLLPDESEQYRLDATRQLVRLLVDRGAIRLLRYSALESESTPTEIELDDAQRLINQPESWVVRPWGESVVAYVTTKSGEAHYRSLFE